MIFPFKTESTIENRADILQKLCLLAWACRQKERHNHRMYQKIITENEAGQRLDKYLQKFMPLAPASFFYKMLRKKNITLNGKRAEGNQRLFTGDSLTLYFSGETIRNFQKGNELLREYEREYERAYHELREVQVVYEDEHVIIMNKPAGILSQKAAAGDVSLNEWLIGYLLAKGKADASELSDFKPSVCNRLDRNTAGLVIGAKTLPGSREMGRLLKKREVHKYYQMFVMGHVREGAVLTGYLVKDKKNNQVSLLPRNEKGAFPVITRYYPVREFSDRTLVEAELITGKSHQIRIQMAEAGYPLLGDYKYGNRAFNEKYKQKFHINSQLLYASRLKFPEMEAPFEALSGRVIQAPEPVVFRKLMEMI